MDERWKNRGLVDGKIEGWIVDQQKDRGMGGGWKERGMDGKWKDRGVDGKRDGWKEDWMDGRGMDSR